jgi:hypothetical protein
MTAPVSTGGKRDGSVDAGGIGLRTFAEDGETSYLAQHPTWVFASSVHMAHPLQT